MSFAGAKLIWMNGQMIPWEQATVHVMAHALHYGSSVFEGIRVYKTPHGPQVFRLTDHMQRFYDSAKIYRMPLAYERDDLVAVCKDVVLANGLMNGAYIRPIAFRGYGEPGLAPKPDHRVDVAVAAWEWGAYLGADGLEQGVDVCISSWQRVAPNTIPAMAKAGGNYLSGQLISTEAKRLGFAEGIALSADGTISEGAGENIFVVKNRLVFDPDRSDPGFGHQTRRACRPQDRGTCDTAGNVVPRRRGLFHRDGSRGNAHSLRRPNPDRGGAAQRFPRR